MPAPIVPAPTTPSARGSSAAATSDHRVLARHRAADDQLLDLRGPLVQGGHARVAEVALDGVVVDVTGSAVHLDGEVRVAHGGLGGEQLGDGGLGGARTPGVLQPAGAPYERAGGLGIDRHVGDHLLHELEARDRAAELLALLRVGDRRAHAALADPDAARGDAVAARVERRHRDLEAVADVAEQRVVRYLDVVELELGGVGRSEAELAVDRGRAEALALGRDEEGGEAAMLLLGVSLSEDERDLRVVAHADPLLLAGDAPAALGLLRAGAQVGGVGARVGLGEAEAAEDLAAAELRQPLVLLVLAAPALDRGAHEARLDGDDGPRGRVATTDLLDDQSVGAVVEPAAAVFLG